MTWNYEAKGTTFLSPMLVFFLGGVRIFYHTNRNESGRDRLAHSVGTRQQSDITAWVQSNEGAPGVWGLKGEGGS